MLGASQEAIMPRMFPGAALIAMCLSTLPLSAQQRPDLSGVWRLDLAHSRMIGGTPAEGSGYQLTWLVNHREPNIAVVVNVRDERGSTEYAFTCTTDRQQCVNELPTLHEVRRMTAWWEGNVLRMSQQVTSPGGSFTANDRLFLMESGEQLVFERVVTNAAGDRPVRQVFRKLGPHPSQRPAPDPLPSVELPPELARVLRDYERHWHAGRADSLVGLFTPDGFIARRGGWVRGTAALREGLQRTSSDLRLRAVAYSMDGGVAYIIGNYGYGSDEGIPDRGMFILTLRRGDGGRWLISADLDGTIRP
jgi:hypothetical protein